MVLLSNKKKCLRNIIIYSWLDYLRFYILFNSISVILERWEDDNERLCVMEPCLWFRRFLPPARLELRTVI